MSQKSRGRIAFDFVALVALVAFALFALFITLGTAVIPKLREGMSPQWQHERK